MFDDFLHIGDNLEKKALELFYFQASINPVYQTYLNHLKIDPFEVSSMEEIPFLPIQFFKHHKVIGKDFPVQRVFKSSGTQHLRSTHYITDLDLYERVFVKILELEYGDLQEMRIAALLPNYQENKDSSLLYMVNHLIDLTKNNGSEFLAFDEGLKDKLIELNQSPFKVLLFGVSYALLDLAEQHQIDLSNCIVLETGGMKGRREELTREELHHQLTTSFRLSSIHSEYGMCELLSQAYSKGKGVFTTPPWMKVLSRPIDSPFGQTSFHQRGVLKIIDLANIYSCAFIETQDIGIVYPNGQFKVLGRLDNAELRGCNLMYTQT